MKQTSFQQLFALFDAKVQIPQQLIIYNGNNILPFANIPISGTHAFLLIINGNITISIIESIFSGKTPSPILQTTRLSVLSKALPTCRFMFFLPITTFYATQYKVFGYYPEPIFTASRSNLHYKLQQTIHMYYASTFLFYKHTSLAKTTSFSKKSPTTCSLI